MRRGTHPNSLKNLKRRDRSDRQRTQVLLRPETIAAAKAIAPSMYLSDGIDLVFEELGAIEALLKAIALDDSSPYQCQAKALLQMWNRAEDESIQGSG